MGVLTDLIIADPSEAEVVATTPYPLGRWPGLDAKGLTLITLESLFDILAYQESQSSASEFALLHQASEEGPWVCHAPDQFVLALAALHDKDVPRVAHVWIETEEMQLDASDASDVEQLLQAMRDLARQAAAAKKSILVWMSL